MDEVSIDYVTELDLSIVTVKRPLTLEELQDFVRDRLDVEPTLNIIWEVWPDSFSKLTIQDLKEFMDSRSAARALRSNGLSIVVTTNKSDSTLMKWYECYAQAHNDRQETLRAYGSMEEALAHVENMYKAAAAAATS